MQSIIKPDQAPYRAGKYVRQPSGYYAFIPKPLPHEPPVKMGNELLDLLSKADRSLGRLDGAASGLLPKTQHPEMMRLRKAWNMCL